MSESAARDGSAVPAPPDHGTLPVPEPVRGAVPETRGDQATLSPLPNTDPSPLPLPAVQSPALAIPGYDILEVIGRGGMGIVYKARQHGLNRPVALKMILTGVHAGPHERTRFRTEAEALARLRHPHIVQIHEVGEHDGRPFLALEFMEGGTLARKLDGTPQPPAAAARLLETLARAVQAAHQQDIIHRDLKPANILLDREGVPRVTDFGLAKQLASGEEYTASSVVLGTPSYMAPEQASGRSRGVGPAADVYALGAILYEMLTGRPPFQGTTMLETLEQVRTREPVALRQLQPGTPRDLETICLKCLEKDPHRRYASAEALADDLRRFLEGRTVQARPVGGGERLWRWCRRNPALAATSALTLLSLLAAVGLLVGLVLYQADTGRRLTDKQATTEEALGEARANFRDARRQWALLALDRGLALCEDGDTGRGLLFLAGSLRYATEAGDRPLEQFLRTSLVVWQRQMLPLTALLPHESGNTPGAEGAGAAFSPDGRTVLTADGSCAARLGDARTGRPRGPGLRHGRPIRAVAFSPDSRTVVTASDDRTARLWDVATGQPRGKPLTHANAVLAAAFSPDNRLLLTGDADGNARLWEVATPPAAGQPRGAPLSHEGQVLRVAFSPDGRTLLTSCRINNNDRKVRDEARLWNAETGQPLGQPMTCGGPLFWVAFSPDGRSVLTAGWDRDNKQGQLRLWSATTGQALTPLVPQADRVVDVAFSPDGKTALIASGFRATLWSMRDAGGQPSLTMGEPKVELAHEGWVTAVAFSPDGRTLLTGGRDAAAQLWDAVTGQRIGESLEHQGPVTAVGFSRDGRTLLTASKDGNARLWGVKLATPRAVELVGADHPRPNPAPGALPRPDPAERSTDFSADGRLLVRFHSPARDRAQLWAAATGRRLGQPFPHQGGRRLLALSADGRSVVTCPSPRTVQVRGVNGGSAGPALPHDVEVYAVACSPDGKTVLTGGGTPERGAARLWDAATGRPRGPAFIHPSAVRSVAFSPDGRTVVTGAHDQKARFWDVATGRQIRETPEQGDVVDTVAFGADGRTVLTVGGNGQVHLWDAGTGRKIGRLAHQGKLQAVAYSPDGRVVVTASGGPRSPGEARLWQAATAEPLSQPLRHRAAVRSVAFSPDSKSLLTASADGKARVWDVTLGRPIGPPLLQKSGIVAAAFDGSETVQLADAMTLWQWRVPKSVAGEVERLQLWAEVISGKELDVGGGVQPLEAVAWGERSRRLLRLGGPGEGEPTMMAPLLERRPRLQEPPGVFPSSLIANVGG